MRLSLLLAAALFAVCSAIEEVEVDASVDIEPEQEEYTTGDAFTVEERAQIEQGQEKHEFKAEVSRLMDIIINSLYSNREIFLRELISNSADALDKARFVALTDEAMLADNEDFDIKIQADEERKTITITDAGVGMTKTDLQKNLGVVAKSGTTEFLEKAAAGQDSLSLIGQFGVGFYSVYLVADKVTVISKHHDDEQYIWESTAQNVYTIAKDPRGNTLGRGTSIILHLKPDAEDFLNNVELERLITHYSQFINFPIFLHETEMVDKEVPVEKSTEATEEKTDDDEDMEVSEEEDEAEEETEIISEEIESWKRINDIRPIWTKSPADVTDEEYNEFYKELTKDKEDPLEKMHFVAEGEISFRALLFVPKADTSVYENYNGGKSNNIKLYVRRVLISEEFDEFLPKFMGFVKGVVDSDDLPLNVSRETLAQSRVLKVMAKKLTRKVMEMFKNIADRSEEAEDDEEAEEADEEDAVPAEDTDYDTFWKSYAKAMKMGIMEEQKIKSKISKLLRFKTTKSDDKYISLEKYVDNMKDDQTAIWYMTGEDAGRMKVNPILEGFDKRDIEVLLLDDAVDEYAVQHIHEVDGISPKNAARAGASPWKTGKSFEADKEDAEPLAQWMKEQLGDKVKQVVHSAKLVESPAVIVNTEYGNTGNMERIQSAQALNENAQGVPEAQKVLEINWRHPIIKEIWNLVQENEEDEKAKEMTWMLFQSAQIYSGFVLHDVEDFSKRINRVVSLGLGVDPDASADDEESDPEVPEDEEEESEDSEEIEDEEFDEEGEAAI